MGATTRGPAGRADRYYRCNTRDRYNIGVRTVCRQPYLRANEAERTVWETCLGLLEPDALAEEYRRRMADDGQGGDEGAAAKVQADLKALERQERRWQDAYAAEAIDLATLKARTEGCRVQRQALEGRLTALGQVRQRRAREAEVVASLEAFARSVGAGLEEADFAKRQQVIRLMVERVVVEEGGHLRIELAIPLGGSGTPGSGGGPRPGGSGSGSYALRPDRLGAEQAHHRAALDREVDPAERVGLPEALDDVLGPDGGRCAALMASHADPPLRRGRCPGGPPRPREIGTAM